MPATRIRQLAVPVMNESASDTIGVSFLRVRHPSSLASQRWIWDRVAGAERHLYVVGPLRVPGTQRVDLKKHVLAGVA